MLPISDQRMGIGQVAQPAQVAAATDDVAASETHRPFKRGRVVRVALTRSKKQRCAFEYCMVVFEGHVFAKDALPHLAQVLGRAPSHRDVLEQVRNQA